MEDIRDGVCPLCRHNEILKAVPQGPEVPLCVTLGYDDENVLIDRAPKKLGVPKGVLVVYTCRRCGFSQLFATLPGQIPIGDGGPGFGATLLKGRELAGPYR